MTSKTVAGLGLTGLHVNTRRYKVSGILLSDGTVIKELELREHEGGALFILQFGEHDITREGGQSAKRIPTSTTAQKISLS